MAFAEAVPGSPASEAVSNKVGTASPDRSEALACDAAAVSFVVAKLSLKSSGLRPTQHHDQGFFDKSLWEFKEAQGQCKREGKKAGQQPGRTRALARPDGPSNPSPGLDLVPLELPQAVA